MASQIKKMEDFEFYAEKPGGYGRGAQYRYKKDGSIWLIKHEMGPTAVVEAYAANGCCLLAGDEYVPETCLVEGFNSDTQQKGYLLASKMNLRFRGIGHLQLMSQDEDHPVSLNNGEIVIHNSHPDGLLGLIIASFILAEGDMAGNDGGNIGVDKEKLFRIDFECCFNFEDRGFAINKKTMHSLFMLLKKFGPSNLTLFMLDSEKARIELEKIVARLKSPEWREKLTVLAIEYEGYYRECMEQEVKRLEFIIANNRMMPEGAKEENLQLQMDVPDRRQKIYGLQVEIQNCQSWLNYYAVALQQIEMQKQELESRVPQDGTENELLINILKFELDTIHAIVLMEEIKKAKDKEYETELLIEYSEKNLVDYDAIESTESNIESAREEKDRIEAKLKEKFFFLTTLHDRIDRFCDMVFAVQASQIPASFFSYSSENSQEVKEMRKIFTAFFEDYAQCVSVLLPNYVETETAACILSWSSEPKKVVAKLTKCLSLVEERIEGIESITKSYRRYANAPVKEPSQYLTKELTEKLVRMKDLYKQLESKIVVNTAVNEPGVPLLETATSQLSL